MPRGNDRANRSPGRSASTGIPSIEHTATHTGPVWLREREGLLCVFSHRLHRGLVLVPSS
jgi:hypothetical protein